MKNHALSRKHAHDETRRRANERARSRQRATAQPVSAKYDYLVTNKYDALQHLVEETKHRLLDFGNTRPVMRAKSNIRYGNPRPMEKAA